MPSADRKGRSCRPIPGTPPSLRASRPAARSGPGAPCAIDDCARRSRRCSPSHQAGSRVHPPYPDLPRTGGGLMAEELLRGNGSGRSTTTSARRCAFGAKTLVRAVDGVDLSCARASRSASSASPAAASRRWPGSSPPWRSRPRARSCRGYRPEQAARPGAAPVAPRTSRSSSRTRTRRLNPRMRVGEIVGRAAGGPPRRLAAAWTPAPGSASCSTWSACEPRTRPSSRTSSPAGSASASASRGRSRSTRTCCCATSRCPRWTSRSRRRS